MTNLISDLPVSVYQKMEVEYNKKGGEKKRETKMESAQERHLTHAFLQ